MPFFRFLIQGEGIRTESGASGFYTVRHCRAADDHSAEAKVLAALAKEWRYGKSRNESPEAEPRLTVLRKWPIKISQLRDAPNGGHVFYDDDPESKAAALDIELEAAGLNSIPEQQSRH